jgi:hypothetical protein
MIDKGQGVEWMAMHRSHSTFDVGIDSHHLHQLSVERYQRPKAQSHIQGISRCRNE